MPQWSMKQGDANGEQDLGKGDELDLGKYFFEQSTSRPSWEACIWHAPHHHGWVVQCYIFTSLQSKFCAAWINIPLETRDRLLESCKTQPLFSLRWLTCMKDECLDRQRFCVLLCERLRRRVDILRRQTYLILVFPNKIQNLSVWHIVFLR